MCVGGEEFVELGADKRFELGLLIIFCISHVLTQEYFAQKRAQNAAEATNVVAKAA